MTEPPKRQRSPLPRCTEQGMISHRHDRPRRSPRPSASVPTWMARCSTTSLLVSSLLASSSEGFGGAKSRPPSFLPPARTAVGRGRQQHNPVATTLSLFAPPGSGYAGPEDEVSVLPATYDPMMSFPGTMRPGKTPENMPFESLPIGDDDPDPVPWPHFQQIEWHHQWEPPHEHPIPMEDFIELAGRWATPEMEAAMRAGVRQNVRERRELEESERRDTVITDDDDEDDLPDEPVSLGEGMFGKLGSDADRAATAAATTPRDGTDGEEEDDAMDDVGLDFLLDLGLDMLEDDGREELDGGASRNAAVAPREPAPSRTAVRADDEDDEDVEYDDEEVGLTSAINVDVDDDEDVIDFGVDDDDDDDDVSDGLDEVPLDDYGDNDGLETDIFEEGGFDYDDYENDSDGGDMW